MRGFVIKYIDIYHLLWEYKSKLEGLLEGIEACEKSINNFIQHVDFEGETATAVKSYMNDVHLTMLSSFKVTAQNILDNLALYKAGYYAIDDATNFVLSEEGIKEFQKKINANLAETEAYAETIRQAVSDISDISAVSNPDMNGVVEIHEQLDEELLQLIADIEEQESSTVTAMENSADLLISSLKTCIRKIGINCPDISMYESYSFYTDADVYALAGMSQIFYEQQQNDRESYDGIWEIEQNLKETALEDSRRDCTDCDGGGVHCCHGGSSNSGSGSRLDSRRWNGRVRACRFRGRSAGYLLWEHGGHRQYRCQRIKGRDIPGERGSVLFHRKCICICGIVNDPDRKGRRSRRTDLPERGNDGSQGRDFHCGRRRGLKDHNGTVRKPDGRNACRNDGERTDSKGAEWD